MRACALIVLAWIVPTISAADTIASPPELRLVHGDADDTSADRKAARALVANGAERPDLADLTDWTSLLADDGWMGPAPRVACPDATTSRAAASLTAELASVGALVTFGRNAEAIGALESISRALPCAGEPLDEALLAQLYFLLGAVHFQEGHTAASRAAFDRAALVDFQVAFDDLFQPVVHDALLASKEAVLLRPRAQVVVLGDLAVRIDGRAVPMTDGVGVVDVRVGPRLVQVTKDGRTRSRRVAFDAIPLRAGVAALAIADAPGLDAGLRAIEASAPTPATAAVLAAMAERRVPWGVLVAVRSDRKRTDRTLTRLDLIGAEATVYSAYRGRADVFGRRVRMTGGAVYRGQSRFKESALHYAGLEAAVWVPIHWLLRAGLSAQWAITPRAPPEGKTVCCSTFELSPRLRAEVGRGVLRPFGEAGLLVFWPAGNLEGQAVTIRDITGGFDVGGGAVLTPPGPATRAGISLTGLFGALAGIGPHVRIRIAAEVRF